MNRFKLSIVIGWVFIASGFIVGTVFVTPLFGIILACIGLGVFVPLCIMNKWKFAEKEEKCQKLK